MGRQAKEYNMTTQHVETASPFNNWLLKAGAAYGVNEPALSYLRHNHETMRQYEENDDLIALWRIVDQLASDYFWGRVPVV